MRFHIRKLRLHTIVARLQVNTLLTDFCLFLVSVELEEHRLKPIEASKLVALAKDLEQVGDSEGEPIVRHQASNILIFAAKLLFTFL